MHEFISAYKETITSNAEGKAAGCRIAQSIITARVQSEAFSAEKPQHITASSHNKQCSSYTLCCLKEARYALLLSLPQIQYTKQLSCYYLLVKAADTLPHL